MSQLINHGVFDIMIYILQEKNQAQEYLTLNNTQLTTLCFNYLGSQLMLALRFIFLL